MKEIVALCVFKGNKNNMKSDSANKGLRMDYSVITQQS